MADLSKLLSIALATSLVACSFAGKRLQSGYSRQEAPDCSISAAPVVDLLAGLLLVGAGVALLGQGNDDCEGDGCWDLRPFSPALLVPGAVYLGGSVYGFRQNNRCERAREAHAEYVVTLEERGHGRQRERTDRGTRAGREDGPCFPNGTCHEGLSCRDGRCVPGANRGALGGRCYRNGTCDEGLVCIGGACGERPPAPTPDDPSERSGSDTDSAPDFDAEGTR